MSELGFSVWTSQKTISDWPKLLKPWLTVRELDSCRMAVSQSLCVFPRTRPFPSFLLCFLLCHLQPQGDVLPPLVAPSPHWQVRRQALTLKRKHPFQPVLSAPLPEFLRRRPPTSHWSPAHLSAAPEPEGSQALEGFGQGPASPCGVVCHSPPWTLSVGPASPEGIKGLN